MILYRNRLGRKKRANRTSPIRQMSFGFPYIYICFDNLLTQQYSIIKRHVSNFFSCHNIPSFKILKPSELLRSYMKNLRKYKILCSTPPETTEYGMVIQCFLFYVPRIYIILFDYAWINTQRRQMHVHPLFILLYNTKTQNISIFHTSRIPLASTLFL